MVARTGDREEDPGPGWTGADGNTTITAAGEDSGDITIRVVRTGGP